MLSVGVPAPLWNWKLCPCQKSPHNHIQATLILLSRNGTTYWREAGYVWSDILDRARAVEADDLVWTWDAFIVVRIVAVDAAADFGVTGFTEQARTLSI